MPQAKAWGTSADFLISREQAKELVARGVHPTEWPAIFNCSQRTVDRALVRYGFHQPKTVAPVSPEEIEHMRRLAADGVPVFWIAETVGRNATVVRRHTDKDPERGAWSSVWASIRKNPALVELHQEFMPKSRPGLAA